MIQLPEQGRGRKSSESQARYDDNLKLFSAGIKEIRSTLEFAPSARGWCYILEEHGLTKGKFNKAQTVMNDCRKKGLLPLDITSEDGGRIAIGIQQVDSAEPEDFAKFAIEIMKSTIEEYTPIGFWENQDYYVEMLVEKIDLLSLFKPVCRGFFIPLTNARGWPDLHSRAKMMERFKINESAGRKCVLLYCGDHDPGGLQIGEAIRSNMNDLSKAVGWSPNNLNIVRFGLNADFINDQHLSWVDNLETSSGGRLDDPKHKDHKKPYVQNYLREFGPRKVEANALVVRPQAARKLCEDAIFEFISPSAPETYLKSLQEPRRVVNHILTGILSRA